MQLQQLWQYAAAALLTGSVCALTKVEALAGPVAFFGSVSILLLVRLLVLTLDIGMR